MSLQALELGNELLILCEQSLSCQIYLPELLLIVADQLVATLLVYQLSQGALLYSLYRVLILNRQLLIVLSLLADHTF